MCQGCCNSLRNNDQTIPPAPYDLLVARSESRAFRDSSGTLVTPRRETVSHYHGRLECIRAVEPNFVPATLRISTNIYNQLHAIHREYISSVFSIGL